MVDAWRKPLVKNWMREAYLEGNKAEIERFSPEVLAALEAQYGKKSEAKTEDKPAKKETK